MPPYHNAQPRPIDVSVDRGCGDVAVAQKLLHDTQIGPAGEQMRGEAVPQHVRMHLPQPRTMCLPLDDLPDRHSFQGPAGVREQQAILIAAVAEASQLATRFGDVSIGPLPGRLSDGDQPLLGALSGLPTALSGAYALSDAARMGLDETAASGAWKQVAEVSPLVNDREAWDYMTDHAWLQSISTGVLLFVVVIWIGCSDNWRAKLHLPLLILLLFGAGLVAAGAWKAGEGVYRRGVAVESRGMWV